MLPRRFLISIAVIVICLAAAGPRAWAEESITALVAASTRDAVEEVAKAFTSETGVKVKVSPGASNALAQQILNGAPADIFISASEEWMRAIAEKGAVAESQPLLANRLVLIVSKDAPTSVASPNDLLTGAVNHVALAGERVPAGKYAEQALRYYGVFEKLETARKIVRGTDVRAAMTYVERGEAEAGIVYATDAGLTADVRVVHTFEVASHEPIVCPAALLKSAADNAGAKRFFGHLRSPAAMEIFARYGFTSPSVPTTQAAPDAGD